MTMMLFYHLLTIHILWHAPFYGWFLLISGWGRRAAILWAVLPPLAICIVEKMVFHTSHFADLLKHRFAGGPEAAAPPGSFSMGGMTHLPPSNFLTSPALSAF